MVYTVLDKIRIHWQIHNKNMSSIHTSLDRQVVIVKSGYDLFPVFSFYEVLKMCCFLFSVIQMFIDYKDTKQINFQ